ncbi:MAG: transcriptional regulator [Spirochaetae bacterium HGW-Spirochaetae-5]|jgi:putative transcriptional regulator|nr:MAG: transcriptional regulator [Spirochaetae bacterium HGW-Spirochaetae-5]
MAKLYKDLSVGESLITALEQAIDYEKGKIVKGVKKDKISVAPLPHYKGKKVKEIRNKLGLTQSTFAHIIGVSIKTVEAWESGRNEPQGPAQRMLFLLERDDNLLKKYKLVSNA